MNHPAEMALHRYMEKAVKGETSMSDETAKQVAKDVSDAMHRQFGGGKRGDFRLRMSNIGKPTCQLWYDKNKPEVALPFPTTFIMNMMLGDIVEAVFKGLLKEAGVQYEDPEHVTLELDNDVSVNGTYDIVINGAVDDVKSASNWSYTNKFESYDTLAAGDSFGYVSQLAGYAKAASKKVGGWWVVNKANGAFKYVSAKSMDVDTEIAKIQQTVDTVNADKFERCFQPVPEKFRGKETGNTVLNNGCKFCAYRFDCWEKLTERPSIMSKAKVPPVVSYIGEVFEPETV